MWDTPENAVYFVKVNGNEVPIVLAPAQKITENVRSIMRMPI